MISKVVEDLLCTGCGTCESICPKDAIKLVKDNDNGIYLPHIEMSKCNKCKMCLKVCPGYEMNYNYFNIDLYGKIPTNILVGNYNHCYTGYSENYNIRYNSSSGGLLTQLLIFALESNVIDGVLVTRMKRDKPLEPEPFIAKTKEEIIEASTSKYCPVPANIMIKEILKNNTKCAVVGLPCHINGIRKAESINKKLKDLIVLHFGLFCGYGINFAGTEILLKWLNLNMEDICKISYRGNGWPGAMVIEYNKNNDNNIRIKSVPSPSYYGRFFLDFGFSPKRCLLCTDLTCELSDVSFGDAWLSEYSNDKIGRSIVIARNEKGNTILQNAESNNKISLREVSVQKVLNSQKNPLYFKKKNVTARMLMMKNKDINIKEYLIEPDIVDFIVASYFLLNQHLHTYSFFRHMLLNKYFFKIFMASKFIFSKMYTKKAIQMVEKNG